MSLDVKINNRPQGIKKNKMKQLKINADFKNLLPPLSEDEFTTLTEDIKQNGFITSIITWNDTIVDGHHRYQISNDLGIDCPIQERDFDSESDAMLWMADHQGARRNMTPKQLSETRAKIYLSMKKESNRPLKIKGAKSAPLKTSEKVADAFGVSPRTIMNDVKKYRTKKMEVKEFNPETQEGKILEFVKDNNGATKLEIAEHFDIPENSAGRSLTNLSNCFKLEKSKEKRGEGKYGHVVYIEFKDKEVFLDVSEEDLKKNFKWIPETDIEIMIFNVENGGCISVDPELFDSEEFQEVFRRRRLTMDRNVEMINLHHHLAYNPFYEENDVKNYQSYKYWVRHKPTIQRAVREWESKIIVDGYVYPAGQYLIDTYIKNGEV